MNELAGQDTRFHPIQRLLGVSFGGPTDVECATRLAQRLQLPLLDDGLRPADRAAGDLLLWVEERVPGLKFTGPRAPGSVTVEFFSPAMAHRRRGGQNELLGRALGWKASERLRIIDGTAGLGRDAYVLADLGCEVLLAERHPVLVALLEDGIARLRRADDPRLRANGERLDLFSGDVRKLPVDTFSGVDALYLDPMFPAGRKALPGKELQVLQHLHGEQIDPADETCATSLLTWGLSQPVKRLVVKRPRRADPLDGMAPTHQITGKAVRFDVYAVAEDAPSTEQ